VAIIGNPIIQTAFVTDQFSGTGSQTAFTMSVAPANTASTLVAVSGVLQDPSTYSVSGTTLTFTGAPPSGTGNISVRYLGVPASSVVSTAYRTITEFTATAAQTTFSPPTYTAGFINVFRNGVRLGSADFTASNGTTVVLGVGASAGDLVTTESYYVSSIVNGLPATGGTLGGQLTINAQTGQQPFIVQLNGTEYARVNSSGNMGVGTSSPAYKLDVGGKVSFDSSNTYGKVLLARYTDSALGSFIQGTDGSGAANGLYLYYSGGSQQGMAFDGGNIVFYNNTGSTERMRLTSSGQLGINQISPGSLLDIGGANNKQFFQNSGATTGYSYAAISNTGSNLLYGVSGSTGAFWGGGPSAAYMATIGTTYAVPVSIATNNTVQLYIDSNGAIRMPNQPALLYKATGGPSFTVAHATYTQLTSSLFNVQSYSRGGLTWDSGNNKVVAPVAGLYYVQVSIGYNGSYLGGDTFVQVYVNGSVSTAIGSDGWYTSNWASGSAPAYPVQRTSLLINLAANDNVSFYAYQSSGSSRTLYNDFCWFQIALLG